jgi:putative SOS response-associated peptidase YedK
MEPRHGVTLSLRHFVIAAARSTPAAKPSPPPFRSAFARRRCIVPAAAFYEWQANPAGKVAHAIGRADGDPLAFAGILPQ